MTIGGLALSAFIVACGDDDTTGGTTTSSSGGIDSGRVDGSSSSGDTGASSSSSSGSTSSSSSGGTDAGADADAAPPAQPAKLTLVNAGVDFGPNNPVGAVRVCYQAVAGTTTVWAGNPPLPNRKATGSPLPYPGLFIGTGGAVPSSGTKLEGLVIRPYLLNAGELNARGFGNDVNPDTEKFCEDILGPGDAGGPFIEGKDFWKLPDIPAGTLKNDKSYFLVLTGCTKDTTDGTAKCGPGWSAETGNLAANVLEVTMTADADKIGFQYINASPTINAALTTGGIQLDPAILQEGDAGTAKKLIAAPPPALNSISAQVQYNDFAQATAALRPHVAAANLNFAFATQIKALSYGGVVPANGDYTNGRAFTVVGLGSPTESPDAGGAFNTKFFHFIVLPSDPIVTAP